MQNCRPRPQTATFEAQSQACRAFFSLHLFIPLSLFVFIPLSRLYPKTSALDPSFSPSQLPSPNGGRILIIQGKARGCPGTSQSFALCHPQLRDRRRRRRGGRRGRGEGLRWLSSCCGTSRNANNSRGRWDSRQAGCAPSLARSLLPAAVLLMSSLLASSYALPGLLSPSAAPAGPGWLFRRLWWEREPERTSKVCSVLSSPADAGSNPAWGMDVAPLWWLVAALGMMDVERMQMQAPLASLVEHGVTSRTKGESQQHQQWYKL